MVHDDAKIQANKGEKRLIGTLKVVHFWDPWSKSTTFIEEQCVLKVVMPKANISDRACSHK